jgi:hypothetical protein
MVSLSGEGISFVKLGLKRGVFAGETPLDRSKVVPYTSLIMRPRVGMYHLLILYEVFRLFLLLKDGSGAELLPVSWYAAAPLLAIVPTLFYIIAAKAEYGTLAFPLIAIAKALGIPSLAMFIGLNAKTPFSLPQ